MKYLRHLLLVGLLAAGIGRAASAQSNTSTSKFGFDQTGMDRTVRPGDDFYRYANGNWLTQTQIPADQTSAGTLDTVGQSARNHVRVILEDAAQNSDTRLGAFYASFMDEAAVNAKGATPIQPWLTAIFDVPDKKAFAAEMAKLEQVDVAGIFRNAAYPDEQDPTSNAMHIWQAGLGMPAREYYLQTDEKTAALRTAYVDYLVKLLTLSGEKDAASRARAVLAFETRIAEVQWDAVAMRDSNATYNRWPAAECSARAPGLDWDAYLAGLGLSPSAALIVQEPSAFAGEARIWAETPLPVLKDWLALRALDRYSRYLSEPFVAANFTFSGKALNGVEQIRPRWFRGVSLVSNELKDEVGKAFIARYFSAESKTAVEQIAANIETAFSRRLADEPWMEPDTRAKALKKLATIKISIGYPESWRDDTGLVVRRDDLFGNVARAELFGYQTNLAKVGKPVERGADWDIPVTSSGGEAKPDENVLIIPAGLLQAPVFDLTADPAINYGAIGIIIGHEFSHFFDDQGRQHDASGRLVDWWTPQDVARFIALTDKLVAQYDAYQPLPGVHVNGRLTLGENIADLAGLLISHDAYILSLNGAPAPVLGGFSGDQRFYLGQAQMLREKNREEELRRSLLEDPHAPTEQRVLEDRNLDSWYTAFNVEAGQKLYLAPDQRIHIW